MIMDLEKLILVFIKAQRTQDFQLYVAAWLGMMKYIFALDHTHYCRWSSIKKSAAYGDHPSDNL